MRTISHLHGSRPLTNCALAGLILSALAHPVLAQPPLHERIDQAIASGKPDFDKQAAPIASDVEFLRRIYLDLIGTIPSAVEARAFLSDPSPIKRQQVIDRLLASPQYARHMQEVFEALLMERRPDQQVPQAQWREYLRTSFAANKPWDELVREILSADGADPKTRAAAKFYLERQGEPHVLTKDVGRIFLGMNLQCAQCHDHPIVDDYKQAYYYGIYAFFNRSFLFRDAKGRNAQAVFAEKADGDVTYQSVFDPAKITKSTGPRMLQGPVIPEPQLEKGKEYEVAPANGVRPIPKFSRRALLAGQVTSPENIQFKRNIVNRLWAHMMGRGIVHPLEFDHSSNPPSHPELLTMLANEFAAMKFDIKALLRELALSKTYQRASELPPEVKEAVPQSFAAANLKPLSPEQFAWSLMQATGLMDAERKTLKTPNEEAVFTRLAANVPPILALFASRPGQPQDLGFQATIDQTLFLANGALLRGWLAPRAGNLADRVAPLTDGDAVAEELYLSILTRKPVAEERKEVADYLKTRAADRPAALQELAWALLTSAEFRFNH